MANVTVKNYREHDIDLNLVDTNGDLFQVKIPAMRKQDNPDEPGNLIDVPGQAQVDEAVIAKARKSSEAVEAYFAERWLRIPKVKTTDNKTPETPAAPPAPPAE